MPRKIGSTYKDYSLLGQQTKIAEEKGLVSAEWYTSPISRKRLKELMVRKDWPGVRDVFIWFAALAVLGYIAYRTWGTWWALPVFAIYGLVYYAFAHSRWHECAHYTAFKSAWLNEVVYFIVSFASIRLATYRRWKHTRHHTDTQIVGRDPEINVPRPPSFRTMLMNIFNVDLTRLEFITAFRLSFGKLREFEKDIIPATESHKMYWEARFFLLVYAVVIGIAIYMQSILPLLYFGLPALYGAIFTNPIFFVIEHGGLHEDVLDHRMCTRTVLMNPVIRFLQGNMNYHMEHHMFPMIPYHALPELHKEIRHDCPEPTRGLWSALLEVYSAFIVQLRDPSYTIIRPLPSTARPYSPNGPYKEKSGLG
ncbi:fatty acid desaturase family protein [Paenibacillus frigoriresistens]|uniref:fatty acid desaturase family protein n=1 Tax=Paenibacillus alginolyticus TaxID=59839 RepID=UPI0015650565|nr:fatty acid desaturase family protein [Paenibacillus frigoriresistens]NRF95904.1 fatty acid desaturase family protein [Paenibacillus frigoriresistens]